MRDGACCGGDHETNRSGLPADDVPDSEADDGMRKPASDGIWLTLRVHDRYIVASSSRKEDVLRLKIAVDSPLIRLPSVMGGRQLKEWISLVRRWSQ